MMKFNLHYDGLVQERRNSIANALELHLSCTTPSIWGTGVGDDHGDDHDHDNHDDSVNDRHHDH